MTSPLRCFDRRNLLTYVSLLSAIGAMGAAQAGRTGGAGALLAAAVIADTFDGRFARRFGRDRQRRAFGAQLDSLSDAIAFGIAPVVCASLASPARGLTEIALWWLAGFAYAACAITRLGFYNLTSSGDRGFIGVPVPVAALIWSTALLFHPTSIVSSFLMLTCGAAMVAPLRVPRPAGAGLAIFTAWPAAIAVAHLAAHT